MARLFFIILTFISTTTLSQETIDSLPPRDTALRIINLNPYITQNIDSVFVYQFSINKDPEQYYWFLQNAPVGLSIGKNNGIVSFRAARNYFQSGKLKYDFPYPVHIGVQSLTNPADRADTSFSILFYNTEIIPSKIKPTVSGTAYINEGEMLSFSVQCEAGSFPIETILFSSSIPIQGYKPVVSCGEEFIWSPGFDFVKETDSAGMKIVSLTFIGSSKFKSRDTAVVRVAVRNALNYPVAVQSYEQVYNSIEMYILQLKYSFLQLDKKLRKIKNTRLAFDLTSAGAALTGTILNTSSSEKAQKTGKVLPSVGLALTPIKEAAAGNKPVEQNQAALIRSTIKRLEYMLHDNVLVGEKDDEIVKKTNRLKEELKQAQVQMIDIPIDISTDLSEEELNDYFNNPKVNKKYRLNRK